MPAYSNSTQNVEGFFDLDSSPGLEPTNKRIPRDDDIRTPTLSLATPIASSRALSRNATVRPGISAR